MDRKYNLYYSFLALLIWIGLIWCGLNVGAVSDLDSGLAFSLRMPRLLVASAIGAGLSISGVVLQGLFSNSLCEPYTLGISSGGVLGAVLGISLGISTNSFGLVLPSIVGSGAFAFLLVALSFHPRVQSASLLLSGVMLGFLGSSLVALWMALHDSQGVVSALSWMLGDLSRIELDGAILACGIVVFVFLLILTQARSLDLLLFGEEAAQSMGLNVRKARTVLILLTSIIVAVCVSSGGMIGFVGLIVPHFSRKIAGSFHKFLLPVAGWLGAIILVGADILSRISFRPSEVPIGVVTAILGAPLFVFLILNQRRTQG
jgi:iron complex transport system permease protein